MKRLKLEWELIDTDDAEYAARAKVPGGWLVKIVDDVLSVCDVGTFGREGYEWRTSVTFVPDPSHSWGLE